jgi:hypothetical protein
MDAPHCGISGPLEGLSRYFSGRHEVSSVFVRPAATKSIDRMEVAVLVKDAGLDSAALARLKTSYCIAASLCGLGSVYVEVLNTSPVSHQYRTIKDWTLVFERNRPFRAWFYEQAAGALRSQVLAD